MVVIDKKNRPYDIVPYDASWPAQFEKEAATLKSILGDEAIAIHHVGSTAIPGISAKPYIDVLVVVEDLKKVLEYYESMKAAGYLPKGNYTGIGEEFFVIEQNGSWVRNIHVLSEGNPGIDAMLDFRDYLRKHMDDSKAYEDLKVELKQKYPNDYNDYKMQKDIFIKSLKEKVVAWKKSTSSELNQTIKLK